MTDEILKYATEAERAKAIESFDESKGSEDDLQKIMDAKIEAPASGEVKADVTPPQDKLPAEKKPDAPAPVAAPAAPATPDDWAKSKGFTSFAEAQKAFDEKEDLIKRQTRFIKEKIEPQSSPNDQYSALTARNQQLETELNALKGGAAGGGTAQEKIEKQESKISVINKAIQNNLLKRKALMEEIRADSQIAIDGDFQLRRLEVDGEQDNLNLQLAEEMSALQAVINNTTQEMSAYKSGQERERLKEQNRQAYDREMTEITEFTSNPKHPEFAFSEGKDSRTVESEYVKWANGVASAMFAGPVNMLKSDQDKAAVAQALASIKANDPNALDACRAAGIPVEPTPDIQKYLDVCDLLNHRDGQRVNPITGQNEQQYRLVRDPLTGNFRKEAVRMASLEDAYQHKMAVDGTYAERIKKSYVQGGKDMAAAAQKRSAGPVVLDNATGVSSADVGLAMTPADAMKELNQIDEAEAMRRKLAGDPAMYDRFEKALGYLETVKI